MSGLACGFVDIALCLEVLILEMQIDEELCGRTSCHMWGFEGEIMYVHGDLVYAAYWVLQCATLFCLSS